MTEHNVMDGSKDKDILLNQMGSNYRGDVSDWGRLGFGARGSDQVSMNGPTNPEATHSWPKQGLILGDKRHRVLATYEIARCCGWREIASKEPTGIVHLYDGLTSAIYKFPGFHPGRLLKNGSSFVSAKKIQCFWFCLCGFLPFERIRHDSFRPTEIFQQPARFPWKNWYELSRIISNRGTHGNHQA